jgi:hypothetical protein
VLRDRPGPRSEGVLVRPPRVGRAISVRWSPLLSHLSRAWSRQVQTHDLRGVRVVTVELVSASSPRRPRIEHPPLVDQWGNQRTNVYTTLSQHAVEEAARRTQWSLAPRMFRMDRHGHAKFAPGELSELLAKLDRNTGELVEKERSATPKALRSLIDDELVCADSTTQCVRLSPAMAQMGFGKGAACRVHR